MMEEPVHAQSSRQLDQITERTMIISPVPKLIFLFFLMFIPALETFIQSPYEYRERGNREEGAKDIRVSAPDLELISFLGQGEKAVIEPNGVLKIRFFLREEAQLFITARELVSHHFYFMKPLQTKWPKGWQEFSPWPSGEVLKPLGISVDQLGLVGRLNNPDTGSGEVVPLVVYSSRPPAGVAKYVVHLRSKENLRSLSYRLYMSSDEKLIKAAFLRNLIGGVSFPITIDLSGEKEGHYKLVIECKYKDAIGGPNRAYSFYHKL